MKVKLKCFAKLSEGDVCDFTGNNEQEISEGETVGSLISRLGFSQEEVKVVFLNSRIVDFEFSKQEKAANLAKKRSALLPLKNQLPHFVLNALGAEV
jgi:hypothetical protein